MVCKKCGAHLLEDDQFCPECGAKVIRKKRCPECGEALREGTRFCPSCGTEIGEAREAAPKKKADSEAAPRRREDSDEQPRKRPNPDSPPKKKGNPVPPQKKRPVQREEPRRRRDWEEEDWDDDEDDEEESVDFLSIMTVAVGCILLVIVAVLGYNLYQRYVPKDYERAAEEQQEEEAQEGEDGQDGEEESQDGEEGGQTLEEQTQEEGAEVSESESGGTLVTIADVRIRTSPSTGSDSTVIRTAKTGETFEYIEAVEGGAWYQVVLTGEEYDYGYISADYVETQ